MKEEIRFYFNQYWKCTNPEALRWGKLTGLMEKIYAEEWEKIPKGIEGRLSIVNDNFKERVLHGEKTK